MAVHDGSVIVAEELFAADRSAGGTLFPLLEAMLKRVSGIEQIAIGVGPGSYAGIRIAIAAALGLGMATEARLVGIPSVAALADGHYAAIGDARRETFYWTEVKAGICLDGPRLVDEIELRGRLAASPLPVFATEPLVVAPHAQQAIPSARTLAELAARDRGIVMREVLEPIYLREPHITKAKGS